ncbi:MAG: 16S rRNA (guanine(527)-N(7))-methyltransferase RsmG [Nocardioidaceae bacterium]
MFAASLSHIEAYAALLCDDGVTRGLIGPREVPRIWERHLLNCGLLSEAIPQGAEICDVGSGAGLPGLVLALLRPDLRVSLVEPLQRRATFLSEACERLHASNVEVIRARAEDLHGERDFEVVTARAVAPLARLVGWAVPLVRPTGVLLAMKGARAAEEVSDARRALRKLRAGQVSVATYGTGIIDPPTTVVRVEAAPSQRLGWASSTSEGSEGQRG